MIPHVMFPDAVALAIAHLTEAFPGEVIRKRVPNPRPDQFVTVLRTGGPRRSYVVDDAQLTVDVWATEDAACADLATEVRAVLNSMQGAVIDGTQVYRVDELAGPADTPDPVSDMPRMRWSVVVQTRGATSGS